MLFRNRKREEPHKGDILLARGIYLKKPAMDNGKVLINCFLRSVIIFLLAFGCAGGFLSSFSISYNYVLVMAAYMLLSLYFSLLYSTSKLIYRDIGYILFFMVFVAAVTMFRTYGSSGLYSVVNTILNHAQSFFNLSGVRQYDVVISNDYFTVAIFAILIGVVMIILLNIWISSSMSMIWSVMLTFPVLLIPLYMKLVPDYFYIVCLMSGYLLVLIFKANGHFVTFSWDEGFRIRGRSKNKVNYTQDSKVFSQILISLVLVGVGVVTLAGNIFPSNVFESAFQKDSLREKTSEDIGNFLLLGFSGMYNRYASTGGLAEGKLGGISNVRPDYQTDLVVTYTPYSAEAIYLKGYTGGQYENNQWYNIYDSLAEDSDTPVFMDDSMKNEAYELQVDWLKKSEYSAMGKMTIQNVGARPEYMYYPYYTLFSDYNYEHGAPFRYEKGIRMMQSADYEYYPKQEWDASLFQQRPNEMDLSDMNPEALNLYLEVPSENQSVIANECTKMGLTEDMSVGEVVETVQTYFEENIPYTLKPGALPRNEDFINYFLTKNRKGYCAHFASAATLMFREMGIPARYVEGYAFSMETALAAEQNTNLQYEDYFNGYSSFGESAVLDVEVDDSMAHAWVEIYVDGFGWVQIEVTPGSNEEIDEDDFWSAFRSMLENTGLDAQGNGGANFGTLNLKKYSWIIYVVIGLMLVVLVVRLICIIIRKCIRYAQIHQKDKREGLIMFYADICNMLRVCYKDFNSCRSHYEQLEFMREHHVMDENSRSLSDRLELISYSPKDISPEALQELQNILKKIQEAIRKQASFKQRMKLWKR